ncbi:hypothetical protein SynBIOSE41_01795 [Synechococcus sp. BIOS-E4-1]|nr:hypothetical protein SynBIOSE41_01795 [Synechococcus sp. BIOS-E4-1]
MSSQYLKRLVLSEVDEENYKTQSLKRVNVVEVLDQDGETFFPSEPDPE